MTSMEPGMLLKSRYKILEQLGKGGMGEVYLAIDETLDTKVAVKANHNLSTHTSAQFIREARLLASLKHPNLPRVIDYFTENDSQYLVMDFIPGDNLKEIVEKKKEFTQPMILKWATQLANALTYLHTQDPPIFHRDIKPANIKLMPSGEVVLVDFGIAKTGDASQETQTGAWAFSPGFAPPEQVSGMRTGPYSDQFSLAATLYYLLTGKPPADSARRMMGEEEYVPLIQIIPTLPPHFSAAIDKALSIKPEARFASVTDFSSALINPVPLQDPTFSQQTVVATRGAIPPQYMPPTYAPTPDISPKSQKKGFPVLAVIIGLVVLAGVGVGGLFLLKSLGKIPTAQPPIISTTEVPVETVALIDPTEVTSAPEETAIKTTEPAPTPFLPPTPEAAAFTPLKNGKVAFISDRQADGYQQVWLMEIGKDTNGNLVAQNFKQLTFSPDNKSNPAWSPDGSKLLYSGWSTETSVNGNAFANDIWMIDLANLEQPPVDLSRKAGDDLYAAWAPNGKHIAFTSYYREDKVPQLFIMKTDGSDQKLLTTLGFAELYSTWTPNGDWLLYSYVVGPLDKIQFSVLQMRDQYSLFEKYKKFDNSSNEGRLGNVLEPALSFDGSTIAYTHIFMEERNIYSAVFADKGRTVSQLTGSNNDYAPCWSPDGRFILFTSERDGDPEVYIMDANGENELNLTLLPSTDKDPAWQPPQIQSQ